MKRILITAALALATLSTQAATLIDNYVSSDGKAFSVSHVIYIDTTNQKLTLTYENFVQGGVGYFADAGGTIVNKLIATGKWVKDDQNGRIYNVGQAHTILCSNDQTTPYFLGPQGVVPIIDPGCVKYNAIKANSN